MLNLSEKLDNYIASLQTDSTFVSSNKLTAEEREFYLNYSEFDKCWYAESSIPKFWRLLEKRNWECVRVQYYKDGTIQSKSFKSNSSKGVSIKDPTITRQVSDEQRQKAKERLIAYQKAKKEESSK